ncbi:hypothetical protein FRC03_003238 [Tulasnella sp. 419]|nr:hypothetical protein FRC02_005352 [Tulasnella sp. 418]KAG8963236.1 hypothetical protein FRC03_003238 [Tulasnella sp. 419]
MKASLTFAAFASLAAVNAHTTFQYFQNAGVDYGSDYLRIPPNNNPVTDVLSSVMGCNVNGSVGKPKKATVAAGSTFTAEFHHESRTSQGIDPSHKGATIAYLAKVSDATTASDQGLNWFKIHQNGNINPWASDSFNANGGKWSFTIPTKIANGDYLLRAETISLHGAASYPGAQLYFGCAQITVTGGTGGSPATVKFPGAYKGSDPGITFQLYYPVPTSYTVPGPAVYTG